MLFFDVFVFNSVKSDFKIILCQPNKVFFKVKEGLEHKINIRRGFYNGGLHNGQKSIATTIGKAKTNKM